MQQNEQNGQKYKVLPTDKILLSKQK